MLSVQMVTGREYLTFLLSISGASGTSWRPGGVYRLHTPAII